MRDILGDEDGTDVNKLLGIVLGIAGGLIVLTGLLWFLYRRYAGLGGSLAGIPPERKMLVFTDLGRIEGSDHMIHWPKPQRPTSAGGQRQVHKTLPAAVASAAMATLAPGATPSPRSRPPSAMRPSSSSIPALSVGLEADPIPSTPGSIASPRGHGRSLFNTIAVDQPRNSNSNTGQAAAAAMAGSADESRPGSASANPTRTSGLHGGGVGGGSRGGSRGGTIDGSITAVGVERPGSGGGGGGGALPRPSSPGVSAPRARGSFGATVAAAAMATETSGNTARALPPALVPTGSVTTAWKASPELGPERSLNSLATATTTSSIQAFDSMQCGASSAAGDAGGCGVGGTGSDSRAGRPPLPYRTSASGSFMATVAATAPFTSGASSNIRPGAARSRPGSGNSPSTVGLSVDGSGAGNGVGSLNPGTGWQRSGGATRSSRTSQGAGTSNVVSQLPDDIVSVASGASSNFQSFSNSLEDGGPPNHQNHTQHQPQQQRQQQQQILDSQQSGGGGEGNVSRNVAAAVHRSRLASVAAVNETSPFTSRQGGVTGGLSAGPLTSSAWTAAEYDIADPGLNAAVGSNPSAELKQSAASVAVTVAAAAAAAAVTPQPPMESSTANAAPSPAAAHEITEVGSVGDENRGAAALPGPHAVSAGGSSSNAELDMVSVPEPWAGSGSPQQRASPTATHSAWAVAVSLGSKLFGRGSRANTPQTSPKQQGQPPPLPLPLQLT